MTPKEDATARRDVNPDAIEQDIAEIRAELGATLDAIQRKLSPGQIMDQAIDYFRGGPRDYVSNLGDALKSNPLPVTLVGIGLAWLMVSGRSREDYEYEAEESAAAERARTIGRRAGSAATGAAQNVRESARRAREAAREARSMAGETLEDVGEGARRAVHGVGETARAMASGVQRGMSGIGRGGRRSASWLGSGTASMARERPLVLAGLALAAGAVLAAVLPASRLEEETLGPAKETLRERARRIVRQELEMAERAAGAALRGAEQQIRTEQRAMP